MGKVARLLLITLTLFSGVRLFAEDPHWYPEEKVISFEGGKVFDFGDILLSDGPVKCSFTFKNIADFPVSINNVISSCGCTSPVWPRKPVAPGERATISVTFSNDQGPFPFDKTLTVYVSSLQRPVLLHVRGVSHEREKSLDERFPEHLGALGLRTMEVNLGNVEQGRAKSERIPVANLSASPLYVEMTDADPGLSFSFSSNPIPPKSTATLSVSFDSRKMTAPAWGRQNFRARFRVAGKKHTDPLMVRAFLRDDFSALTPEEVAGGPKAVPVTSYHEFGEVTAGTRIDARYQIKNTGRSDLIIRTVEFESGEGASGAAKVETRCPLTVRPGATATLRVTLETFALKGEVLDVLTLVTNAPAKPLVNLFLTGNVIPRTK